MRNETLIDQVAITGRWAALYITLERRKKLLSNLKFSLEASIQMKSKSWITMLISFFEKLDWKRPKKLAEKVVIKFSKQWHFSLDTIAWIFLVPIEKIIWASQKV